MPSPTTFRRRDAIKIGGNGARHPDHLSPRLAPAARRRSTAAIVLAVLCIAGGALAGLIAYKAGSSRQSVLAASHSLPAGHILQAGDLRVVDVSTDGGLALVLASDEGSLIGRPLGVPIAAGAPLTSSELGSVSAAGPGEAVVGVLCKAGQYPPSLAPGDRVELVDSGGAVAGAASPAPVAAATPGALADATLYATVTGVDAPTDTATAGMIISLRLSAVDAPSVARAAAAGDISLILVQPGG
jgi:Flp pilus assembly protein CpaB